MSLNPCGVRSARPTDVSLGDNHLSVIATTSSFLDEAKFEKLAHFEVKDRTFKVAIRIKSEPDGPGFKLTSPASKMSVEVQKLSFEIGRKRNLLFVHMYRHGSFSVNVGLFTTVFGCGKHSLSPTLLDLISDE